MGAQHIPLLTLRLVRCTPSNSEFARRSYFYNCPYVAHPDGPEIYGLARSYLDHVDVPAIVRGLVVPSIVRSASAGAEQHQHDSDEAADAAPWSEGQEELSSALVWNCLHAAGFAIWLAGLLFVGKLVHKDLTLL